MNRKPALNASLIAIIAEGFSSRLSFGLISFILPLYAHHLGLNLTQIGLLVSVNTIVAIALKPLTGWLSDRVGLKRIFVVSIFLRSLVALLNVFAIVPWQLYSIRTAHGLATSLRDPSSNALIADNGGEKAVASAFAWYQTAKSVAGSLGKALAGVLLALTAANYPLVFFISFLLSVLPLIVVVLFVKEVQQEKRPVLTAKVTPQPVLKQAPKGSGIQWQKIAPYIGFGFLISCTAEMMTGLFPILAVEYAGLSEVQVGIIFSISTFAVLILGPLFGWLSDHVSRKLVLMIRAIANMLSSLIFIFFPGFLGIAIGKLVDDSGKAAFRPAWGSVMAQISSFDKQRRAQTMSLMSMGEDAGDIVGPILAGFLWSTWGITFALGTRVALAIITEIYSLTLARSMEERNPQIVETKDFKDTAYLSKIHILNDDAIQMKGSIKV